MSEPEHISKALHKVLEKIRIRTNVYRKAHGLPLLPTIEEMENKDES